jgi:hypothetical protein
MPKYIYILITIILFLIIISVITIPPIKIGTTISVFETSPKPASPISFPRLQMLTDSDVNKELIGHYETIEETIARIKRDVMVTGVLTGTPGQETALFQIEGLPDQSFHVNTQLMDGFIITRIDGNQVVLKNQIGDESFSLKIR